jgi:hypothetical protein
MSVRITRKTKIIYGNGAPFEARKVGRNDPCPCKSGKKAKNCCGTETDYHYSKKTGVEEKLKKLSKGEEW